MSMGITQMNSLLSSASALKSVNNLSISRTQMNGQSRIMSAEINADKVRGVDTKKKEEKLAETEERLQNIEAGIGNSLANLNERLEADREKIREEEDEQARMEKNAQEKAVQTGESAATSPAIVLELSGENIASGDTGDEQAAESVIIGESKSDIAEVPSKTAASSSVDANYRNAIAAYTKGKSTGDLTVLRRR